MILLVRLFLLLTLVTIFVVTWLAIRRSPAFTTTCETLVDDSTANAVSELHKAERDVDRELKITKKRIKKSQSVEQILANARKGKQ